METTLRAIAQLGLMFRWLVDDISGQAVSVLKASDAIARGNSELSHHAEQAAANVQRTASTMNEMTAVVKSNTDTAQQMNSLSACTRDAAMEGGRMMQDMVDVMAKLTENPKKITNITDVIDTIAFQTNILALNAAVEAARAVEQGKGFAVVAGEVRGLARRSAAAANEIKQLIDTRVSKVQSGSRHVNDAGSTVENIASEVKNVTSLIAQISTATAGQGRALGEVSVAIEELDSITHKNTARMEEGI